MSKTEMLLLLFTLAASTPQMKDTGVFESIGRFLTVFYYIKVSQLRFKFVL